MLSAGAPRTSAEYVALKKVERALAGKRGGFVLQRSGTMDQGRSTLEVSIVPGADSGELAALRGRMSIDIVEKQRFYTFDFSFVDEEGAHARSR
jgi:Protein of unknown function (DUF3224)